MIQIHTQREIDSLIISDISTHPGTKQEHVVKRNLGQYSRSYILTTIDKLIATGKISESRDGRNRILFSPSSSPSSSQKVDY